MIKRHFLESKDHLIDKLYNLDRQQKEEIKAFFKKHPNYENKIDWNNRDLKYRDFRPVLELANKAKSAAKKGGLSGLVEGTDYKFFDSNKYWNIYQPLNHWGSKILASNKVGLGEITAKWCISSNTDQWWKSYTRQGKVFFFLIATSEEIPDKYKKIAICYDAVRGYNPIQTFDAEDHQFADYEFDDYMAAKVDEDINWRRILQRVFTKIKESNPKDLGTKLRAEMAAEEERRRANDMSDNLSAITDGDARTFGWNYTFRSPKPENLYVKVLMLLDGNKQMRKADILTKLYVNEDIPNQTSGNWEYDRATGRYHWAVKEIEYDRAHREQHFQTDNNAHGYESNLFTAMRNAGLLIYNRNRTWSWGPNAEPYVQYWHLRARFSAYRQQHPEKEY